MCGYDDGLANFGADPLVDELPVEHFRRWVDERVHFTDEHEGRLNARSCLSPMSYAELRSADDTQSLEVYFDLWSEVLPSIARQEERPSRGPDGGSASR